MRKKSTFIYIFYKRNLGYYRLSLQNVFLWQHLIYEYNYKQESGIEAEKNMCPGSFIVP
jgi:hypothetical protein